MTSLKRDLLILISHIIQNHLLENICFVMYFRLVKKKKDFERN